MKWYHWVGLGIVGVFVWKMLKKPPVVDTSVRQGAALMRTSENSAELIPLNEVYIEQKRVVWDVGCDSSSMMPTESVVRTVLQKLGFLAYKIEIQKSSKTSAWHVTFPTSISAEDVDAIRAALKERGPANISTVPF